MSLQQLQQEMMETYKGGMARGLTQKEAAKEAQARTGLSVRTGMPIKGKAPKEEKGLNPYRAISKSPSLTGFGMY